MGTDGYICIHQSKWATCGDHGGLVTSVDSYANYKCERITAGEFATGHQVLVNSYRFLMEDTREHVSEHRQQSKCEANCFMSYVWFEPMSSCAIWIIRPKCILNSNLAKFHLPITYSSVVQSFWNFVQNMAVILSCSLQNCKMIGQLTETDVMGERMIWRDLILKYVSDAYLTLHKAPESRTYLAPDEKYHTSAETSTDQSEKIRWINIFVCKVSI